jgi:hypothetical protein
MHNLVPYLQYQRRICKQSRNLHGKRKRSNNLIVTPENFHYFHRHRKTVIHADIFTITNTITLPPDGTVNYKLIGKFNSIDGFFQRKL